jgi:hypothetical protein
MDTTEKVPKFINQSIIRLIEFPLPQSSKPSATEEQFPNCIPVLHTVNGTLCFYGTLLYVRKNIESRQKLFWSTDTFQLFGITYL